MADPGTIAVKAALTAASMALQMTQKIEGPRLDDLGVSLADYGTPITYFWGKRRLEGRPIIWAEPLREKKKTSKGKGGKYAEYQYFGSWACLIAGHEIDAVSRIWLDKHLVYDATKAQPMSPLIGIFRSIGGSPVKLSRGKNMRIYDGTQTEPDRRMEEWCEDRYGADTCPAYKGMSYIVFEELPLEKFGNRIPQVTIEAVNNKSDELLYAQVSDPDAVTLALSPDYERMCVGAKLYDTATRSAIVNLTFSPSAIGSDGTLWEVTDGLGTGGGPFLTPYFADGQHFRDPYVAPEFSDTVRILQKNEGGDFVLLLPFAGVTTDLQLLSGDAIYAMDMGFVTQAVVLDAEDQIWAIGGSSTSEFKIALFNLSVITVLTVTSPSVAGGSIYAGYNDNGELIVVQGSYIMKVDTSTGTVTQSADLGLGGYNNIQFAPGHLYLYAMSGLAAIEVDIINLTTVRTFTLTDWVSEAAAITIYDPINHAFVSLASLGDNITWRFIDRIGSSGTLLSDVVEDTAERCGFELSVVDTSDLDQVVEGYSVTQGPGKDWISPLLDIHDVDARPHDFGAQFINRGTAAIGTIETENFVREGDEARYTVTVKQDTDLPRRISLNFADQDKDQQNNTVISQRPLDGTDATREQSIDLSTYVGTPGDIQKILDRYFRRQWNERETISLALTAQHLAAEPGDAYNLDLDGATRYARIKKLTLSGGKLSAEFVRDALSLNTLGSGTGADMGGRDEEAVYISGPSKGIILDIPLVRDSHNDTNPLLYYGAGSYANETNFPGAIIYERDADDGDYFEWNGVESADRAVWGYATDVLSDANPDIWDGVSTVNILVRGELTSTTQAAIDANPLTNLAYLGADGGQGELFNFATATLESDGSYTLSGFKRGRRGTEGYCDDHAIGDTFVLVSSLDNDGRGLDDIGSELAFKAQTLGRDPSVVSAVEFDYTGATIKPYAPCQLTATRDTGTGDWVFTWVRRTRVGGNWGGGAAIPLGETSENYKVKIYDGDTVVRTITATTETATYTSAQQTTDFGGAQASIVAGILQVADAVDGFEATIERGPPTSRGAGEFGQTNSIGSAIFPGIPDGTLPGELMILACETNAADTISAPSGWEATPSSPQAGTDSKLHLFWRRAGYSEQPPTVVRTGDHLMGQIVTVSGAVPRGNPFDASAGGSGTGGAMSITGLTTTVDNCLVLDFISSGNDVSAEQFSSWANADLTALSEVFDRTANAGGGGGVACNQGTRAVAGAVGTTTVTQDGSSGVGFVKLAIRPE